MISFTLAALIYILLNDWDESRFYFGMSPIASMTVCIVINIVFRRQCYTWLKYLNNAVIIFSIYMLCGFSNTIAALFILVPLLNSFYYRTHLTVISAVVCFFVMYVTILSITESYYTDENILDNNILRFIPAAFSFSREDVLLVLKSHSLFLIIGAVVMVVSIYLSISGKGHAIKQGKLIAETIANQAELETARNIQDGILSTDFPDQPSYAVCADMTPAEQVGGDFYDFFTIDDTHIAVAIGDVSGHGVAAALFMTLTKTLLKVYAQAGYATDKVMAHVNRYLLSSNPEKLFVTGWIGILDLTTGKLRYCNAGHEIAFLVSEENIRPLDLIANMPIGVFSDFKYESQEEVMESGTTLFTYTDGLTEAMNEERKRYGIARVEEAITSSLSIMPKDLITHIDKDVHKFVKEAPQSDDLTMLAIKYNRN